MVRPRLHRDWQRPDLERLRKAPVRSSTILPSAAVVLIDEGGPDERPFSAFIPSGLGEVSITEAMRDEIIAYIEKLEALVDERLGQDVREHPPLTPLQSAAIEIEVAAGAPKKANMGFGLSSVQLARSLMDAGLSGRDGVSTDTIDGWRALQPYRAAYIDGLTNQLWDELEAGLTWRQTIPDPEQ